MSQADIAVIGLAVMGQNLVLNIRDHGFKVAVYNRTASVTDAFMKTDDAQEGIIAAYDFQQLVNSLSSPRKVMLMVQAGGPVDAVIESLLPLLDDGDVIIDGGNSHFPDTVRRNEWLSRENILFIGTGVSGGEEGARRGPSMMPGGNPQAWPLVKDIFQSIAAQVDDEPCCQWIGEGGAGHYVKMVHNGIEYGDMQLIAESYQFMHQLLTMNHQDMHSRYSEWNDGVLSSYLIEITADIMLVNDVDGTPLVEKILDSAGQKGTGKWTVSSALDQGVALTMIAEAVFSRFLSSVKDERVAASAIYSDLASIAITDDKDSVLSDLQDALYASKIMSYAQGFMLMKQASDDNEWALDYGNIALTWRGGCIIRSAFLNDIKNAYDKNSDLDNLLMDHFFVDAVKQAVPGWRRTVQRATAAGLPIAAMASALSFFDGYRSATTSANLLQAQRDYFGAHTYERTDKPRGEFFHTEWIQN